MYIKMYPKKRSYLVLDHDDLNQLSRTILKTDDLTEAINKGQEIAAQGNSRVTIVQVHCEWHLEK